MGDDNYARPIAILAHSVLFNLRTGYFAEIIVLETNISEEHKEEIKAEVAKFKNGRVRFVDMSARVSSLVLPTRIDNHFTKETYYRLFIEDIAEGYDKVICLDGDMVVDSDISELYETDISGYLFGATLNVWTQWCISSGDFSHGFNYKDYMVNTLGLRNPLGYFSAGMMVMDIRAMRDFRLRERTFGLLGEIGTPKFADQCLLNVICEGRVKTLPYKWAFVSLGEGPNEFIHESWLRQWRPDSRQYYQSGEQDPRIIHYEGPRKPWKFPQRGFARLWWRYARKCDFYDDLPHPLV